MEAILAKSVLRRIDGPGYVNRSFVLRNELRRGAVNFTGAQAEGEFEWIRRQRKQSHGRQTRKNDQGFRPGAARMRPV